MSKYTTGFVYTGVYGIKAKTPFATLFQREQRENITEISLKKGTIILT